MGAYWRGDGALSPWPVLERSHCAASWYESRPMTGETEKETTWDDTWEMVVASVILTSHTTTHTTHYHDFIIKKSVYSPGMNDPNNRHTAVRASKRSQDLHATVCVASMRTTGIRSLPFRRPFRPSTAQHLTVGFSTCRDDCAWDEGVSIPRSISMPASTRHRRPCAGQTLDIPVASGVDVHRRTA